MEWRSGKLVMMVLRLLSGRNACRKRAPWGYWRKGEKDEKATGYHSPVAAAGKQIYSEKIDRIMEGGQVH
jgi:hypothetical protein